MGRAILKFGDDKYVIWSSIVDAPVSYFMTLEELQDWVFEDSDTSTLVKLQTHMMALQARLKRCDRTGTSMHGSTIEGHLSCNRAGPNEECLTRAEIEAMLTREGAEDE